MTASIRQYDDILHKVEVLYKGLKLDTYERHKGRKLALPVPQILAVAIFKQTNGIQTKKAVYVILEPECAYKTLVVNLNRFAALALLLLQLLLARNRAGKTHPIKHTDATEIPVCSLRKAGIHRTMRFFARFGKTGKGWFYGLKLHLTTDLNRRFLAVKFTAGNVPDLAMFEKLNKELDGIFVADAAYVSEEMQQRFSTPRRIVLAIPRINMRKIMTDWQCACIKTRMLIELNFRNLKLFFGLVTSLPRSADGYLANYIYALLAYCLA